MALAATDRGQASINSAPVAADDAYTTTGYAPLDIPAPGVLGNDSDPDGDPLTATLESGPNSGSLVLNSDGSFLYQPTPGSMGTDTFTYIAAAGDGPLAQAYWPFEEGSGTNTADATGHGHDGTLVNGPLFTTTVPVTPTFANSYALDFDGVDDYVLAPAIDLANRSFSVAFWARRDKLGVYQFIVSQGTNSNNQGLHIGFRDSNVFTCAFWGDDVNTIAFTDTLNWHHWTCTYDASANAQTVYLDGTAIVTRTANNDYQGSGPLHIGNHFDATMHFEGLLDDVRIYETALTAAQVQEAMTSDQLTLGDSATVNITVPTGALSGAVTDSANGNPIPNATVAAAYDPGTVFTTLSDDAGIYSVVIPGETYTVSADAFGYHPAQFTAVSVPPGLTTTLDIPMDPLNHYVVDGVVTDTNTGWPLYASLDIDGYPGDPIWTDPETGYYSISLPEGITYTFNAEAWVPGYNGANRDVGPLTGDATENFALDADVATCDAPGYTVNVTFDEGFEGSFPPAGWSVIDNLGGTTVWDRNDVFGVANRTSSGSGYSAAAEAYGSGVAWDTELWSPPLDLSTLGTLLSYASNFQDYSSNGDIWLDISADGGSTWINLRSQSSDDPSGGTLENEDLSAYATDTVVLRWRYAASSSQAWYWHIDEVEFSVCNLPSGGGLVVGNVYDDNTLAALNGAMVENEAGYTADSVATPLDEYLDDGFYVTYAPAGSATLTATLSSAGYGADIDAVTVIVNDTVAHDFYLPAGQLEATHDTLSVTLNMGISATLPLTLSNLGNVDAAFEFVELGSVYNGFIPTAVRRAAGTTTLLYRSAAGVPVKLSNSGSRLAYPAAYRYTPAYATSDINILVYVDEWIHPAPNTFVQQALGNLGLAATVYADGDVAGFQNALNTGGPWDLVIWAGENYFVGSAVLDDLLTYLQSGGCLVATYWEQYDYPTHPLWAEMGFSYVSNYVTPPPVYWWEPSYPIFNAPQGAPEWIVRDQAGGLSNGSKLEPLANGIALAGYTTTPSSNEAAMVLRDDGRALYKGMLDASTNADDNGNGIPDGTELWMNIITYMAAGADDNFDWLSESPITGTVTALGDQFVDIIFDAGAVNQPGVYYATLRVNNDTPYDLPVIPVTMTVNTPSTWGKVAGTLTLLGYCDADPSTPAGRKILIEGSSGFTATTTTDENGYYQWWIDPSESLLTVTVTPIPDYETGMASGVQIVADQTTTVDFDLRWLQPCVSVDPASYEKVLFLGDMLTDTLALYNGGAISTTFDITETSVLTWLAEAPLSGTLDVNSMAAIDIVFDGSIVGTGAYIGELRVDSDDPVHGSILIPIEMAVVSGATGVAISPDSTLVGRPGALITHTFTVTNSGDVVDIYDLSLSGNSWTTSDPPANTSFMDPGETFTFTVAVEIPDNPALLSVIIGSDSFNVTATSQLDGSNAATTGATLAEVSTGVSLSDDQAASGVNGDTLAYTVSVTNTGSFTDTFDFALAGSAWNPTLSAADATLGAGASTDVTVTVTIPPDAAGGSSDVITLSAVSQLDPATSGSAVLTTTVALTYGLELAPAASAQSGEPGTDVVYTLVITNTGNTTDTFTFVVSDTWGVIDPTNIALNAGATRTFDVVVSIPAGTADGDFDTATVIATSTGDSSVTDQAILTTTAILEEYRVYLPLISKR